MKLYKSSMGASFYYTYKCVKTKSFFQLKKIIVVQNTLKDMELPSTFEVTLTQLSCLLKGCQDHIEITLLRLGSQFFILALQKYLAKI